MKYLVSIIAVVVLGVGAYLLLGQGSGPGTPPPATSQAPAASDKLPALTLQNYDGNDVALASFSGTPLIVNSWAVWCPFCRKELPDFAALQQEFPDIKVIAIDRQESSATAKGYSDELGVTGKLTFLLDPGDSFYRAIGGFTMPETLFVDKDGAVVFHKRGPLTLDEMKAAVDRYLR